jgi:hypothetical protein
MSHWLRFSPSFSEGGRFSGASLESTFADVVRKGKASMGAEDGPSVRRPVASQVGIAAPSFMSNTRTATSSFMVDARRAHPGRQPSPPSRPGEDDMGWQLVTCRRFRRRSPLAATPPTLSATPRRPVPIDLIGCCFNCLMMDHVAAVYTHAARCMRCHREGH